MKCERVEYLIAQVLSGNLDEKREKLLEKHLHDCISCREAYETQSAIEKELKLVSGSEPDAGFALRTANLLDKREALRSPGLREILSWMSPAHIISILSAIALIVVWITSKGKFIDGISQAFKSAVEIGSSSFNGFILIAFVAVFFVGALAFGVSKVIRDS